LQNIDHQLHFAQKISKKYLKLAEIDSYEYRVKIGFFRQKNPISRKTRGYALNPIFSSAIKYARTIDTERLTPCAQ